MCFGNSKVYFKWSCNVCVRSTNRSFNLEGKVKKKILIYLNHMWVKASNQMRYARAEGVSHQAVVVPIRGCGSQRADSLPTQPLPTNCYCDKSHRYKICRLPEGKQSYATQPCFEAEFIKATVPTAWILPASLQQVIAKRLVVQVTWCGECVQSVRPNQTDTWPPKHTQVWHL